MRQSGTRSLTCALTLLTALATVTALARQNQDRSDMFSWDQYHYQVTVELTSSIAWTNVAVDDRSDPPASGSIQDLAKIPSKSGQFILNGLNFVDRKLLQQAATRNIPFSIPTAECDAVCELPHKI